jgi:hypothetical protein
MIFDETTETLTTETITLGAQQRLALRLASDSGSLMAGRDRRLETARKLLRAFRLDAWLKLRLDGDLPALLAGTLSLRAYAGLSDSQARALAEVLSAA